MPTFHDPLKDAAEASEALRGLAHASRVFDDPADTYPVFGDLVASVRSLRQVLDQLANTHLSHRDRAHDDDGDHLAGSDSVFAAADELHHAGTLLDQAQDRLDAAFGHSGRIAWHPETAISTEALAEDAQRRWVSVVFLQGEEAAEVLALIDRDGTDTAITHLAQWDFGEETTEAAMENGYVYDPPPTGALDRVVTEGDYALTYNPAMGHVSLLRQHTVPPDAELDDADVVPAREAIAGVGPLDTSTPAASPDTTWEGPLRTSPAPKEDWFAGPTRTAGPAGRGLSL